MKISQVSIEERRTHVKLQTISGNSVSDLPGRRSSLPPALASAKCLLLSHMRATRCRTDGALELTMPMSTGLLAPLSAESSSSTADTMEKFLPTASASSSSALGLKVLPARSMLVSVGYLKQKIRPNRGYEAQASEMIVNQVLTENNSYLLLLRNLAMSAAPSSPSEA